MNNETLKHVSQKIKALAGKAADTFFKSDEEKREAQDLMKRKAARAALAYLEDEMILGVGTGSTVNYFIEELKAYKGRLEGVVASSEETARRVKALGIPLIDLNSVNNFPLYIDGADEVGPYKRLIKGGGGALTREKIIATAAKKFICIIDESKRVDLLGTFPVPVEVIPLSRSYVARQLVVLGADPVYREGFLSDNGHMILDVYNLDLLDPVEMETRINHITGVVENGIFAHRPADLVLVGGKEGVERY